MISTGDKLLCVMGNDYYTEGATYTVGEFINDKYFELLTGFDDECWYATIDKLGIYVSFSPAMNQFSEAWFEQLEMMDAS